MYHPATSPSALLVDGRVPAVEPGAASGASKLANCPSGNRSKPWALLLASKYCPVIVPTRLMLKGAVPWKVPGGGTCGARLRIVERGEGAVRVGHKAVEHEVRV